MNIKETALNIAQGNPGAIRVLAEMAQVGANDAILDLERAGVRGSQVWLIYKDACGQDLVATVEASANIPKFIESQSDHFRAEWAEAS